MKGPILGGNGVVNLRLCQMESLGLENSAIVYFLFETLGRVLSNDFFLICQLLFIMNYE